MREAYRDKKITEKVFGRVLISSICGIFLCLACLVSATWAWYVVGIENPDNTIEIANVTAQVAVDGVDLDATADEHQLAAGTHTMQITLENKATSAKLPVYVLMSVDEDTAYYFTFAADQDTTQIQITVQSSVSVSFSTHWEQPAGTAVDSTPLVIGELPAEDTGDGDNAEGTDNTDDPAQSGDVGNTDDPAQGENVDNTGDTVQDDVTQDDDVTQSDDTTQTENEPETGA